MDDEDKVIGVISLSDLLLYLVLRPCGDDDSPEGVCSVRAQDDNDNLSQTASISEEITEAIPEEEEHAEPNDLESNKIDENIFNTRITVDVNNKTDDSNDEMLDSPVLDKASLSNENPIFREVTVSGGE